jgi:hypothetical protein
MPLPYTPQFAPDPGGTGGLAGGGSGAALAAGASATVSFSIGCAGTPAPYPTACLSGRLQLDLFASATVSATNGLQWTIASSSDGGLKYDGLAYATGPVIPATASTVTPATIDLPPGQYQVAITNLDATYGVSYALSLGWLS